MNKKESIIKKSSKKQSRKKQISKKDNSKKEKFEESVASPSDIIDLLSVSPSASDPNAVNWQDQITDYGILLLKYLFLVVILTLNFLGLSVSLNCNADEELFKRILSAIFAFFFGFVYLIVNYYTYQVLSQGKICKMNREKLFPFKT